MRRNLTGRLAAAVVALGLTGILAAHRFLDRDETRQVQETGYAYSRNNTPIISERETDWAFYIRDGNNLILVYDHNQDNNMDEAVIINNAKEYGNPKEAITDLRQGKVQYIHLVAPGIRQDGQFMTSGTEVIMNNDIRRTLNRKAIEVKNAPKMKDVINNIKPI